ncbi:MAG: peptidylprolyl isomerase [Pseudomonadota bacterium]|nr:peptidylprolyl isomerase [Pseudomonadota bacterium]
MISMRSVLLSLCLLGLAACDGSVGAKDAAVSPEAKADVGETLASVNGEVVGSKEFEQAAARKAPASGDALSAEEKKEVLDSLVEEKLLYAEALRKHLDRDPKVQKVMVNTLLREDVYSTVKNGDFNDEMLQTYYEEHKSEFVVPEKVQIKRILIKVTEARPDDAAKLEAERIRGEIVKTPDSFKDLAAKFSEDPYKRRGGDVGFVSKEGKPGLDAAIVDKAFSLETGAVSDVFKTTDGYNVVQVAARREQVERTFQQMKGSVLRKVKNDKMKELYDGYVAKLKTGATIQIDETKVAAVEIKNSRRPFTPGGGLPGAGEGEEGEEGGLEAGGEDEGAGMPAVPAGAGTPPPVAPSN